MALPFGMSTNNPSKRAATHWATNVEPDASGLDGLVVPAWRYLDWLWHRFSTRRMGGSTSYLPYENQAAVQRSTLFPAGELNLGLTPEDERGTVFENRARFVQRVTGSSSVPLATLHQVHSNRTVVVDGGMEFDSIPAADGLITHTPGILIGIQTADCVPVLVIDIQQRIVAGFHAGWRGTVQRVVELGVRRLLVQFGSKPEDLQAAIGPSIGPCCYSVGDDVQSSFGESFEYAAELFQLNETGSSQAPVFHLDLREANRRQLLNVGLREESISVVGGCTSCNPELYFSHRASGGKTGRMMAVIGVRNKP